MEEFAQTSPDIRSELIDEIVCKGKHFLCSFLFRKTEYAIHLMKKNNIELTNKMDFWCFHVS